VTSSSRISFPRPESFAKGASPTQKDREVTAKGSERQTTQKVRRVCGEHAPQFFGHGLSPGTPAVVISETNGYDRASPAPKVKITQSQRQGLALGLKPGDYFLVSIRGLIISGYPA